MVEITGKKIDFRSVFISFWNAPRRSCFSTERILVPTTWGVCFAAPKSKVNLENQYTGHPTDTRHRLHVVLKIESGCEIPNIRRVFLGVVKSRKIAIRNSPDEMKTKNKLDDGKLTTQQLIISEKQNNNNNGLSGKPPLPVDKKKLEKEREKLEKEIEKEKKKAAKNLKKGEFG
ncbi:hypothetical protein WA026_006892 [Henosepilachna vigintioctopunctata]|uniref:Uncharacterized protein n=1 Tax=Henosepilachna vigintioctopunctata TaxID=420089 RepID=A0AAW1V9W5_9CUCU